MIPVFDHETYFVQTRDQWNNGRSHFFQLNFLSFSDFSLPLGEMVKGFLFTEVEIEPA